MSGQVGWIVVIAVLALPIVLGLTREVRVLRRVTRADRAMRALAATSGWELEAPAASILRDRYLYHFPWVVDAPIVRVLNGSHDGHEVIVGRARILEQRRGLHWFSVSFRLPREYPILRLERGWSGPKMGITVPGGALYAPIASDVHAITGPVESARIPERLLAVGAPAVSLVGDGIMFLYHPMPDVPDLPDLIDRLGTLLPDVLAVAELLRKDPAAPEDAS
ncbi:hypothetical protein V1460_13975 [Streptomyces sp. SCSIO 30461]|uniref:hypothetical protein n=1 Tax=Streptomyces sp. SCSIO 30461 TaxID=3118085 RepID=UPI0030CEE379